MATTVLPRPKQYDDTFFKPISIWLTTTDHKLIGIMYMVTSIISFVIGGIFALIIRLQLSQPNLHLVDAETYNQLISAHGVTMIFFFVTIFVTGIANYMVPLMIGARDMAFPRVNLLGFWCSSPAASPARSSSRRRAARCSPSTCSGSSAIPRST